jgi:hypothetical protein
VSNFPLLLFAKGKDKKITVDRRAARKLRCVDEEPHRSNSAQVPTFRRGAKAKLMLNLE